MVDLTKASSAAVERALTLSAELEKSTEEKEEATRRVDELNAAIAGLTARNAELQNTVDNVPPPKVDYQVLMAQQNVMAALADLEPEFLAMYESCREYTMTSVERLYGLYKTIEYVVKAGIPGDVLECGVWRGGGMMLAARALMHFGATERRLLLFDTFEGHPKPDETEDIDLWGNKAVNEWRNYRKTDETSDWAYVSLDEVRENMTRTGYPPEKIVYVKGMVEKTAPTNVPARLAVLRMDTDWYASARDALEHFFPVLSEGGILIVDDYGHYKGQRKAVDEYFEKIRMPILLNRLDYSCRLAIKLNFRTYDLSSQ